MKVDEIISPKESVVMACTAHYRLEDVQFLPTLSEDRQIQIGAAPCLVAVLVSAGNQQTFGAFT